MLISRRIGLFGANSASDITTALPGVALHDIPYKQLLGAETSIHNVARAGETYVGNIGVSNTYDISWYIIDSLTLDVEASGTGNIILHTFTEADIPRAYDIKIVASWSGGSLERYLRRGIRYVSYPVFNEGDLGVTVIDVSTHSGYTTTPPPTNKVLFKGVRNGSMNLNGWTLPGQTIVIQNKGLVEIKQKWVIGHSIHRVLIDGCCDNSIQYGFEASADVATNDGFVVAPGQYGETDWTTDVTVGGVKTYDGITGFHILPPRDGADIHNEPGNETGKYPVAQLGGFRFCNCLAYRTGTEGLYMGYTRDYESFAELLNPIYHHIVCIECGWDGIQPGNSTGVEVHDCDIISCGQAGNNQQWSGISTNGFTGILHHLYIYDHWNSITGSTGRNHGGYHMFRMHIESEKAFTNTNCWNRLGDGTNSTIEPVDLCIYDNVFDTPKQPFQPYLSPGASDTPPGLNYQYDDNIELNVTNPDWNFSFLVDLPYTKHWMAQYSFGGYKASITTDSGTPSSQATSITASNRTASSVELSWTRGSGEYVVVFMREGAAIDFDPIPQQTYLGNTEFGVGSDMRYNTGIKAVYKGTDTSAVITGLTPGETYYVRAYEVNNSPGYEKYITSTALGNPFTLTASESNLMFNQSDIGTYQTRAISGPFKADDDFIANSPGDWDRIVASADAFVASPTTERWDNLPSTQVTAGSPNDVRQYDPHHSDMLGMRSAAFVYAVTGNATYGNAVKNELYNYYRVQAGLDMSNTSIWDYTVINGDSDFVIAQGWTKIILAYDMTKDLFSSGEQFNMELFIGNAAEYLRGGVNRKIVGAYVGDVRGGTPEAVWQDPQTEDGTAIAAKTYHGGDNIAKIANFYNNRRTEKVKTFLYAGLLLDDSSLIADAKTYFNEWLQFAIYPDGMMFEQGIRWKDTSDRKEHGYFYAATSIGSIVEMAHALYNSGDDHFYTYSTSGGFGDSVGGPKTLELVINKLFELYLSRLDGTITPLYVNNHSGDVNYKIDGYEDGLGLFIHHLWAAAANRYYKSQHFYDMYTMTHETLDGIPANPRSVGGFDPWEGVFRAVPGVLFMHAGLEGL